MNTVTVNKLCSHYYIFQYFHLLQYSLKLKEAYLDFGLARVQLQVPVFSTDTVCTEAEMVAGRPRPCGKTEFTCSNQRCVPTQLQCDLFSDCGDGGSDEQDCKACKCSTSWLEQTHQRIIRTRWKVRNATMMLSGCSRAQEKCNVMFFMVIHVCPCFSCVVYYMKDFCTSKETHSRCVRCRGLKCNQSPVFICSFQWRCMREENKSMWRRCNLQPDKC